MPDGAALLMGIVRPLPVPFPGNDDRARVSRPANSGGRCRGENGTPNLATLTKLCANLVFYLFSKDFVKAIAAVGSVD